MLVITKISKDSPPAEFKAVGWAYPGRPCRGSGDVLPGRDVGQRGRAWALGSPSTGAEQMALQFQLKNAARFLRTGIKRMQSLMQTAHVRNEGLRESARTGWPGPGSHLGAVNPGWFHSLFGTGEHPGKPPRCSCWGCWKSQGTTILRRAGKPWKCAPWGLIPDNNPAFKKTPLVICGVLLYRIGNSAAEKKELQMAGSIFPTKKLPKANICLFPTHCKLFVWNLIFGFFFF